MMAGWISGEQMSDEVIECACKHGEARSVNGGRQMSTFKRGLGGKYSEVGNFGLQSEHGFLCGFRSIQQQMV